MGLSRELWAGLAAFGIFFLQFVTVPFLGDIDMAGKLFLFACIVLLSGIFYFQSVIYLRVSSVLGLLTLLLLIFFASAAQAFQPAWAFLQVGIFALYLLFLLMVAHGTTQVPIFRYKLIDATLFFGVLAAILGLYEYHHFLLFGPTRTMLIPYLLPPNLSLQVTGPYGQPNLFAVFLTVVLLAFFFRYLHPSKNSPLNRLARLRFIPFFLVAFVFFLTGSRGGLLSASLILGFLAWLVASDRYLAAAPDCRKEFLLLMLYVGGAALFAKGVGWWCASGDLGRALTDVGVSTDARFIFWTSAIFIFGDHPWLGVGLDGYRFFQNTYGPISHDALGFVRYEAMGNTLWTHNELLQILCEGGVLAFALSIFLLGLLLYKIYVSFVKKGKEINPLFIYSHLFLLPFIIQSNFEWPFRSPPLLILFFSYLGVLLSQYSFKSMAISAGGRRMAKGLLVVALGLTSCLLYQEISIGTLGRNMRNSATIEETLVDFELLANNPYSEHRVLSYALPRYAREALSREDNSLAERILPYYVRLCTTQGVRWHWYNLALIYAKLGQEADARLAIQHAIDLMPPENLYWDFMHYLNVHEAVRATGRPIESFFPIGTMPDFSVLERSYDGN